MGNHDIFIKHNNRDYAEHFEEITAYKVFDDLICSHIPLHPASVKERWKANVHGHLHTKRVMMSEPTWWGGSREVLDPKYLCVSMEHIDYTPITMDEVYRRIEEQQHG
jgi:calcineurin-like phosphoesterase family protein